MVSAKRPASPAAPATVACRRPQRLPDPGRVCTSDIRTASAAAAESAVDTAGPAASSRYARDRVAGPARPGDVVLRIRHADCASFASARAGRPPRRSIDRGRSLGPVLTGPPGDPVEPAWRSQRCIGGGPGRAMLAAPSGVSVDAAIPGGVDARMDSSASVATWPAIALCRRIGRQSPFSGCARRAPSASAAVAPPPGSAPAWRRTRRAGDPSGPGEAWSDRRQIGVLHRRRPRPAMSKPALRLRDRPLRRLARRSPAPTRPGSAESASSHGPATSGCDRGGAAEIGVAASPELRAAATSAASRAISRDLSSDFSSDRFSAPLPPTRRTDVPAAAPVPPGSGGHRRRRARDPGHGPTDLDGGGRPPRVRARPALRCGRVNRRSLTTVRGTGRIGERGPAHRGAAIGCRAERGA